MFTLCKLFTSYSFINVCVCFLSNDLGNDSSQINPGNMLEDVIADYGGLKQAYLVYKSLQNISNPEPPLPRFENYTPEQMFWISYARLWCPRNRKDFWRNEFRVNGPLFNMPEFANDFHCRPRDSMRLLPDKMCHIWWFMWKRWIAIIRYV